MSSVSSDDQLAMDLRTYGASFYRMVNGQKVRIPPWEVVITKDGQYQVNGEACEIVEQIATASDLINEDRRRVRTLLPPNLAEAIVADTIRNVCELPDYTSPPDKPDLLQCTARELETCIRRALGEDV